MASDRRPVRCIGSLDDDAVALARRVHPELAHGSLLVWAEADGSVHVGSPDEVAWLPPSWIAGLFPSGHSLAAIADDVRSLAAQRMAGGVRGA